MPSRFAALTNKEISQLIKQAVPEILEEGDKIFLGITTGNPGSVIVPQYRSSKITVFVWGKNIILKFLGNTK